MRRPERVAELMRAEIMQIVGYELDDPRLLSVIVTDVRMSEDLRNARVYVSFAQSVGEPEIVTAIKTLRHGEAYIKRQLGIALGMKHTPHLHFVRDQVEERATRLEELFAREITHEVVEEKHAEISPLHREIENGVESLSRDRTRP